MDYFCRVKWNLSSLSSNLNGIKDVYLAGLMAICFWKLVCCSLLKIWNMNKYIAVLGVFNCQGPSWSQEEKINMHHDENPKSILGSIHPQNVHLLVEAEVGDWDESGPVYYHKGMVMFHSQFFNYHYQIIHINF